MFGMQRITPMMLVTVAALGALACSDTNSTAPSAGAPDLLFDNAKFVQIDRFGIPAIATVFIPTSVKDAYNTASPVDDRATYRQYVVDHLIAFGNPNPQGLADALMPDIQPVDLTQPTNFLNGRAPWNDVITAELGLIFGANADLNDDHVDQNDKPFLTAFPYLAEPHSTGATQ